MPPAIRTAAMESRQKSYEPQKVIDTAPRVAGLAARAFAHRPRRPASLGGGARGRQRRPSLTPLLALPAWLRAPLRIGRGDRQALVAARAAGHVVPHDAGPSPSRNT